MRVVFSQYYSETKNVTIPAVLCTDFFADEINSSTQGFFDDAFPSDDDYQWLCPDTENLELFNTEYQIYVDVRSCEASEKYGTSPVYGDQKCEPFEKTQESFDLYTYPYVIFTQHITKYFNPITYLHTGEMEYMIQNYNNQPLQNNDQSILQYLHAN